MPGETSREIEAIFGEAADLPPEARDAFLRDRCPDPEVRRRVEALLRHDLEAGGAFLAGARRGGPVPGAGVEAVPERVGGYRIVGLIGEGGMGLVYEARQDHPDRAVALKVIRPGMISRPALRRFESEAEVLGRLAHPGIASIYEAGRFETPEGPRPFIAMELVRGEPLDRYCRSRGLSVRRRVELMARVCEAVDHAHTRGVIHRDLKPGNILVDDAGEPRVLDFGIARLVRAGAEAGLASLMTHTGQMLGTLPYMSPEQVGGDPASIDARTDVYALGVILYELLAGRTPMDLENLPLPEAARRIREDEPRRLVSVSRTFAGDLDTITGRALAKEPERRYRSASELAEDLRRYMGDEPIRARPTGTIEQLRKFARRNPGLAAGVAFSMLSLAAGVVAVSMLAVREHAARVEADASRHQAERNAYRASLAAALGAVRSATGTHAALRVLDEVPAALRGWEWRLARRAADPSVERIPRHAIRDPGAGAGAPASAPIVWQINAGHGAGASADAPAPPGRGSAVSLGGGRGVLFHGPTGFERRDAPAGALAWSDPPGNTEPTWIVASRDGARFAYTLERESRAVVRASDDGAVLADVVCADPVAPVFSPDGSILAVGPDIIDVQAAAVIRRAPGPVQAISRDNRLVIELRYGPSNDRTLAVTALRTGETLVTIPTSYGDPWGTPVAVFSGDERAILVSEQAMKIQTFDARSGARLGPPLLGIGAPLVPDAGPGLVGAWVASTWELRLIPDAMPAAFASHHHLGIHASARLSPDGTLAARGDWCTVSVWDTRTGAVLWRRSVGTHEVRTLAYSPDGAWLAFDAGRGRVATFRVADGTPGVTLEAPDLREAVSALAWRDPDTLAVGHADGTLVEWRVGARSFRALTPMGARVAALAYAPGGSRLAAASDTGGGAAGLVLLDTSGPRILGRHRGPEGGTTALAFSPDGAMLALAEGETIHVYRAGGGPRADLLTPIGTLLGGSLGMTAVRWTDDGARVLAGTRDGQILVWDRVVGEQRELCAIVTGHEKVYDVALAPGEGRLVATASDATVAWEIEPLPEPLRRDRLSAARAAQALLRHDRENRANDEIRAEIVVNPSIPDDLRGEIVAWLDRYGDNAARLNSSAWGIVVRPDRAQEQYERAVVLTQAADRAMPGRWPILNTLGYAYLRAGRDNDAVAALLDSESRALSQGQPSQAVNWCAIAVAQHRMGMREQSAASLARALALVGTPGQDDPETRALVAEAQALIGAARER